MKEQYFLTVDSVTKNIQLSGELVFSTVNSILVQAETVFEPIAILDIDLSEVERSDSAGLALLIHWIRLAKKADKKIVYHNIPKQMSAIADATGMLDLLPTQ